MPDLTHLLRRDEEAASFGRYKKLVKLPVDAEVLERVTAWVARKAEVTAAA